MVAANTKDYGEAIKEDCIHLVNVGAGWGNGVHPSTKLCAGA